ncbi:MAG: hypothetical protein AAF846_19355 [Chloroflexota bacterium]
MPIKRATTVADAKAQSFDLPDFKDWRRFAGLIDGYAIAEELKLEKSWHATQKTHWQETSDWELDVLHLRLVLFFAFRSDYMSGYTYTEHDEIVDSILHELSKQLDLPYAGRDND